MPTKKMMRGQQNADVIDINRAVVEYLDTKSMSETIKKRVETMKANIRSYVEAHGEPDEKGNIWYEAGEHKVKIERRASVAINHDKAEQWLKEHGLWNNCSTVVPARRVLDEDKLLALGFERKIPKKIMDGFTVVGETFAFKTF